MTRSKEHSETGRSAKRAGERVAELLDGLTSVVRPRQARSLETLERLLDAAEEIIEEKGLADASIPEIVRRGGSSVGGFYARFHDKAELLRALEERFFNDLYRRLDRLADASRWGHARLGEILQACADELVRVTRQRGRLIRAFFFRASQEVEFHLDALRFRTRVAERLGDLLTNREERIAHPDPRLAIDVAVQLAFGLVFQLVIGGDLRAGGRVLSDEEMAREIVRVASRYLGLPEDGGPGSIPTPVPT